MSVTTQPFDPAISSADGDLWTASTQGAGALQSLDPTTIGPGQTGTIPVRITPTQAQAGQTVSGTLYVDDLDDVELGLFFDPNANQVAAIPYTYTVAK